VATEQMRVRLSESRNEGHERCVVCAPTHPLGLRIEHHVGAGGVVQAELMCHDGFQGYPGQFRGGVITSLLDSAMTNCLFAHGIEAVTAELKVRFLRPVLTDHIAVVSTHLTSIPHRLYIPEAELIQKQPRVERFQGKFVKRSVGLGTRGQ
jgi:hypothetical protein